MAVIGKIRQRAGLLIGIVGFSLVAFILGDLLTSNRNFLSGPGTDVAVIGGKKIDVRDFEVMVAQFEENYRLNTGNTTIDQATKESLREQAWTELLNIEIMEVQYDKAGLKVSPEELFDMIQGKNPHSQIKEAFKDPNTGEFSASSVIQFLQNMDNDETGKTRAQWLNFEKYMATERLKEKYDQMIKHGIFTTSAEAKAGYTNQKRTANVRFIDMMYTSVADSSLTFTDEELKKYYNANKSDFEQESSRSLDYVVFEVIPSSEDRENALSSISQLVTPFGDSDDDSLFVAINADTKSPVAFHKQGSLSPAIDSVFFNNAPVGTVVGPYEENNSFVLSKLVAVGNLPDSLKVSHALIAYTGAERAPATVTRTREEAQLVGDSLLNLINSNSTLFNEIARNQSDDAVAAQKDGDLDWITKDSPMDPRFKDGAFATEKGKVSLVESNFGFHLIKVTDQTTPARQVKVASIDRTIVPGTKTYQSTFSKANEFAGKNNSSELFEKSVQEQGLNKRVAENLKEGDKSIPGLESPRALIQWAYQSKLGDVSKAYDFGNKFVVALITDVKEKGTATFDQVKDEVTAKVATDKKASQFIEKFNKQMEQSKSIDDLAIALNVTPKNASNVSFASSYVPNLGTEPAFVGSVFSIESGKLSMPIKGTTGVFVLVVDQFNEAAETTDYTENKKQIQEQNRQRASYEVFNALKEKADVVDNRGKFY